MTQKLWLCCALFVASAPVLGGPLNVVATTTDIAWAIQEIGGDNVQVRSLLNGTENPHYVEPPPEFIRLVSEAQMVCQVGVDLEAGWLPKVLARSGNKAVQPGNKGHCDLGTGVDVLDRPKGGIPRSFSTVHPSGTPHYWLSPRHLAQAGKQASLALSRIDPTHRSTYETRFQRFEERMKSVEKRFAAILAPFAEKEIKPSLLEYHSELTYFLETYGLRSFGSIEEKPGVSPSAGRLAEVALAAKAAGVKLVIASETAPIKTLERFQELSGVPYVRVPVSLHPTKGLGDYEQLQKLIADAIAKSLSSPGT